MREALKGVFRKKPELPKEKPASSGQIQSSSAFRVRVPKQPISNNYLEELKRQLAAVGIVKQAAYAMLENGRQKSYLLALDLEVERNQEQDALNLIASTIHPYDQFPFKGPLPVDYALWSEQMIQGILKQNPNLHFFTRL